MNSKEQVDFPEAFIKNVKKAFPDQHQEMLAAILKQPKTSIRFNKKKIPPEGHLPIQNKIAWSDAGYFLTERPSFTTDPLFHAGCYYPQEASSMFLDFILKQIYSDNSSKNVLDLCGAPGGKSTLLADFFDDESFILSNEVINSRAGILHQNMTKWGRINTHVSNSDPKVFSKINNFFDLILIDAPCSGEGLFRKDSKAVQEWSLDNVNLCSLRQKRIVSDVLPALKEDGFIIYSTCTFNEDENIKNLEFFCNELDLTPVLLENVPDYVFKKQAKTKKGETIEGYHFLPHLVEGEGFFVGILKKKDSNNSKTFQKKTKPSKTPHAKIELPFDFDKEKYVLELKNQLVVTHLKTHQQAIHYLKTSINFIKTGLMLGEIKGKDFVPSQELALSIDFKNKFPSLDLNLEQAISYLKKADFKLDTKEIKKGFYLVKYLDYPLGFIKVIPGRFNNLYPKNWRILKT